MENGPKILIGIGIAITAIGIAWLILGKFIPFGKLPGDIAIEKENVRFYFPLGTSILLSVVLSLLMYVISFFRNR